MLHPLELRMLRDERPQLARAQQRVQAPENAPLPGHFLPERPVRDAGWVKAPVMSAKTEAKQICHCRAAIGSTHGIAFRTSLALLPVMHWQSLVLSTENFTHLLHELVDGNCPMRRTQDNPRGLAAEQRANSCVAGVL